MDNIFCTIFTPAYNRKDLMMRLYKSLCAQKVKNFEWVIVDDGSNDGTEQVFSTLTADEFNIIYKRVQNGGKHRAINHGLDLAHGKVFAIVDSDDYLVPEATEKIELYFDQISKEQKKFAGIALQKCYNIKDSIGSTFDGIYVDATSLQRREYNIYGDKFEVFYTNILKKNKFPEFENERFLSEAVVWNRIAAQGYLLRWYNDNVYVCEYLEGGLTDGLVKNYEKSPRGYLLYIKELTKFGAIDFKQKMGHYSLYRKVRRKYESIFKTAQDLEVQVWLLWMMYIVRIILDEMRKIKR